MEINRKELKRQARQLMGRVRPTFLIVTLVYILMTSGVSILISLIPLPNTMGTTLFINILYLFYSTVMSFGYLLWALWTFRQLDPGLNSIFEGFSVAGRVILLFLSILGRVLAIAMVSSLVLSVVLLPISSPLLNLLLGTAIGIGILIYLLRYTLAPYLLADHPEAGPGLAIRNSVALMEGWKMEQFKLALSFLGWQLLNIALSAGVAYYFIMDAHLLDLVGSAPPAVVQWAFISLLTSMKVKLATLLVTLPLQLWRQPYQSVTMAGFYDARIRFQKEHAPNLEQ